MPSRTMEGDKWREEKKNESTRLTDRVNKLSANWIWRILAKSNVCAVSKETAVRLSSLSRS